MAKYKEPITLPVAVVPISEAKIITFPSFTACNSDQPGREIKLLYTSSAAAESVTLGPKIFLVLLTSFTTACGFCYNTHSSLISGYSVLSSAAMLMPPADVTNW